MKIGKSYNTLSFEFIIISSKTIIAYILRILIAFFNIKLTAAKSFREMLNKKITKIFNKTAKIHINDTHAARAVC